MSYCRWSSDNWQCDLYCYADVNGGYTTWVAGRRHKGDVPKVPNLYLVINNKITQEEWSGANQKQMEFLDSAEFENINLPYDGECFNDPDLQSFLERLLYLRKVGYRFPDYVIERVKEEMEQGDL